MRDVEVAGVATTAFGKHLDRTLGSLAHEAVAGALDDARLAASEIGSVVFSNAAAGVLSGQEMIRGQVALKGTGLEGLSILNTENACASGSSAAHLAWLAVASGQVDVAIAVGAEKLFHPDKQRSFAAIESGTDLSLRRAADEMVGGSVMMGAYAQEARAYAARHGDIVDALAAVAVKNRAFASANPHAQFREPIDAGDVASSREVADPLRLLMCSPLTDGAAAVVFRAVDTEDAHPDRAMVTVEGTHVVSYRAGASVVERAASAAYRTAGITARDVDVFQLHDACAFAELVQYEQVGITPRGSAKESVLEGRTAAGGDAPVNTDGGLLSRGHALGATGLAQIAELTAQLQNRATGRQVAGAGLALAVNSGGWMGDDYAVSVATLLARH